MIDKALLSQTIEERLNDSDYYLVSLTLSAGNAIVVEIDAEQGVDLDFCVALTRHIESVFDREVEDYELEVGSAGLTSPFKVLRQYEKNLGNEVEVLAADGIKLRGVLAEVTPETFTVEVEKMQRREGEKRKTRVVEPVTFPYDKVKYTKIVF